MYTQCPECSAAFRVTANDLKQAAGKVRCGGCGRAFDALEFLSEEIPVGKSSRETGPKLPELKPDIPGKRRPRTISPEDSIALLKTLDQLAGSDIRLEDTGIEWRVLDDQVHVALETKDEPATDEPDPAETDVLPDNQQRYDDDTPLDDEQQTVTSGPDEEAEELTDEIPIVGGQPDIDFDDDETGEWEEILDEVDDSEVAAEHHPVDGESDVESLTETIVRESDDDTEPRAEAGDANDEQHSDVSEETRADDDDDQGNEGVETQDETPDEGLATEDNTEQPVHEDDAEEEVADEPPDDESDAHDREAAGPPDDGGDAVDEDAAAEDGDDRPTAGDDDDTPGDDAGEDAPVDEQSPDVREEEVEFETIILEGDTVRSAHDEEKEGAPVELPTSWEPAEESVPVQRSTGARVGTALAAALLLAVLGLQVVHQKRTTLATIPAVHKIIAPVYRAIGMPLVPQWDVRGWRFEATQGNTDADQLIVYSRLGNTTDEPLPYPLIGVSLTDRFEETVGGVLLEPAEYLARNQNPRDPVAPGDTFDAVITLPSPDAAATGYRLRACYRAARGKLRCAVGDFKP